MNRVWIVQKPMRKIWGERDGKAFSTWAEKADIDLSTASQYGEVVVIWEPDAVRLGRATLEKHALEIASQYAEGDYIIALGSPTLICLFAWAIGHTKKKLKMLEWSKQEKCYFPSPSEKGL